MRMVLIRDPASPELGIAKTVLGISGVEHLEIVGRSLRAVAIIRSLRPDVVVMETDGCESDGISLLNWIRSGTESPHTILIGQLKERDLRGSGASTQDLHCFDLPREYDGFRSLVSGLVEAARGARAF